MGKKEKAQISLRFLFSFLIDLNPLPLTKLECLHRVGHEIKSMWVSGPLHHLKNKYQESILVIKGKKEKGKQMKKGKMENDSHHGLNDDQFPPSSTSCAP